MTPVLKLRKGRERSVLHRHPWIFSGGVLEMPAAAEGDIVAVTDVQGNHLAYGFYSPQSQITCRLFAFGKEDPFQEGYWMEKLRNALELRKAWIDPASTNCFRWLHAEGDFFPGLIADVYGEMVVVQVLIKGTWNLMPVWKQAMATLGYQHVFLKNKNSSRFLEDISGENQWISGGLELPVLVKEHDCKFEINPDKGQKTGFFLDQRENRRLLGSLSKGKRVLNTFSYTGGFSIYALQAGASEVVSVDISKDAIAGCEQNVRLNFGEQALHRGVAQDCFDFLKQDAGDWDIVILDPPAFAKNARSVPNACRGYKELNMLGLKKVKPGGLVFTFSCSQNIDRDLFQKVVFGAAADVGRNVRILQHLQQPEDHPTNIYHPEGTYLKGLLLHVS